MYTEVTDFIEIYQSVNMDCDSIINWFINNKDKQGSGIIYRDTDVLVDIDTKDTIDISLSLAQVKNDKETSKIFYNLFANVSQAFKQYIKKYNILEDINIEIDDSFNIAH